MILGTQLTCTPLFCIVRSHFVRKSYSIFFKIMMNVWMEDTGVIKTPSVQTRRAHTRVNVIKVLVVMDTVVPVI